MKRFQPIFLTLIAAAIGWLGSCNREETPKVSEELVLLSVGDSILTMQDVVRHIPAGLAEEDSIVLFNSIVDTWVQDLILVDMATENLPDMDRINRMVADYRNRLIMMEYRRRKKENTPLAIHDADIRKYYEANADDMRLEHPVIKGIYIKVPSNADRLENIRQWVFSATTESIDKLEKYGLKGAMQYDWFGNRWVDWEVVADQIPYRFYDADAFVESTVNFETEYNGSTYFLHITEFLKSGDVMPYSFAKEQIQESMIQSGKRDMDARLMQSLFNNALKTGKLKAVSFDPVKHRMIPHANPLSSSNK